MISLVQIGMITIAIAATLGVAVATDVDSSNGTLAANVNALPFTCSWTAPDGSFYDLSSLKRTQDYTGREGIWQYWLNVCGTSSATGCGAKEAATCQGDPQTQQAQLVFGYYGTSPQPTWQQISADPNAGVQMTFNNGQPCAGLSGAIRTVIVKYTCAQTTASTLSIVEGPEKCTYRYTLASPAGCPSSAGGKSGLSGGSVFLIILLVGTTLYISIGCVYKSKTLGTSGVENCPNIAFWKTLPGLVMDGCRYTKRKIMTPKGDSYQQV